MSQKGYGRLHHSLYVQVAYIQGFLLDGWFLKQSIVLDRRRLRLYLNVVEI
jgi:hypothetical protein